MEERGISEEEVETVLGPPGPDEAPAWSIPVASGAPSPNGCCRVGGWLRRWFTISVRVANHRRHRGARQAL